MTSESDAEFLDSMEQWVTGSLVFKAEHRKRLFTLARRGAAMQWRPVEEAPKDGGPFLVFGGTWEGEISGPSYASGSISLVEGEEFCVEGTDYYSAYISEPTHFMPLPPPPAGEPSDE